MALLVFPAPGSVGRPSIDGLGEQRMLSAIIGLQAFTLLPSFWIATRWGSEGVVMVWLCVYP